MNTFVTFKITIMAFMPQVVVAQVILVILYLKVILLEVVAPTNFMDITILMIGL